MPAGQAWRIDVNDERKERSSRLYLLEHDGDHILLTCSDTLDSTEDWLPIAESIELMPVDDTAILTDLDARWADLARTVELPAGSIPMTLPPGGAVIVRPDRYVAAVAHDAAELAAAGAALLTHVVAQPTERPSA